MDILSMIVMYNCRTQNWKQVVLTLEWTLMARSNGNIEGWINGNLFWILWTSCLMIVMYNCRTQNWKQVVLTLYISKIRPTWRHTPG